MRPSMSERDIGHQMGTFRGSRTVQTVYALMQARRMGDLPYGQRGPYTLLEYGEHFMELDHDLVYPRILKYARDQDLVYARDMWMQAPPPVTLLESMAHQL